MNRFLSNNKQSGFSLTESLIALVILSFGLIALVKFQVSMVGYGGLIKSKTAAIALAQEKMENLRNMVLQTEYTALTDTLSTSSGCAASDGFAADTAITKVNTVFTRCHKIVTTAEDLTTTPATPGYKTITAKLVWTDTANTLQTVSLNSIISWNDPRDSAQLSASSLFSTTTLTTPTGGATMGGTNNYSGGMPAGATSNGDGTSTYQPGNGTTELIDNTTGSVLLTVVSGQGIASISGRVYVEGTNASAETTANATYPVISDSGYCTRTFASPIATVANKFTHFDYTCYTGSTWYGNVGIVRTDNPNSNARSCLGDPTVTNNAVLSAVRTYRGYATRTDGSGNTIVDGSGNPVYFPVGISSGTVLSNHHFLVTTITGNPVNSDCVTPMSSTPTQFGSNPDDFFCLTNSCPGAVSYSSLAITGTYTAGTVANIQVTNGGLCSISSGTFTCNVTYVSGNTWSGSITTTAAANYDVCTTNPLLFSGLSADSSGNVITLAATGTCGGGGGVTTYNIGGSVTIAGGHPTPKTTSLSSLTLTVAPSTNATCTYFSPNGAVSYGTISCDVPTGFTGTITLSGFDSRDNANILDYSAGAVSADLTGQNISITP